jgi:hypothetical protein
MASITIELPDHLERKLRLRSVAQGKGVSEIILESLEEALFAAAPIIVPREEDGRGE